MFCQKLDLTVLNINRLHEAKATSPCFNDVEAEQWAFYASSGVREGAELFEGVLGINPQDFYAAKVGSISA
jgi:hypothetical protein